MSADRVEIPLGLRSSLEAGQCALFVGAGVGLHLQDSEGQPAPNGRALASDIATKFGIDAGSNIELAKIAEIVEIRKGRKELETYVRSRLQNIEPDEIFGWISSIRWKAIFTTNYDSGIERAYELKASPPQTPVPVACPAGLVDYDPRFETPVYYLHGCLNSTKSSRILITETDYIRFRDQRRMLFEQLKTHLAVSNILYIGYSNQDPNWRMILDEVSAEFAPARMPTGYRVSPADDPLDIEILLSKGVHTIPCDFARFVSEMSQILPEQPVTSDRLRQLQPNIPTELLGVFEENPAPVVRLLDAWTFVNGAPFGEAPNTYQFLRGERPNWALVAARHHFERDIEQVVYESLLDYATSSSSRPRTSLILGPAGYGTTTLLMSLAASLVRDQAGPIFMLKPGRPLREGDVEFACSSLKSRPIFFVDDASRHHTSVLQAISRLRELHVPAMFMLGARLNEWGQTPRPPRANPHRLEPLSDPEITRLLKCLATHNELNKLAPLTPEQQFSAVKQKHKKELLVAMREATEGDSFDAILEDEFRRLPTETAKRGYLVTCCLHQLGNHVRTELLAQSLGMSVVEMHDALRAATEGVILFEAIDDSLGLYAAQARHRVIATIVWERCATAGDKEAIVHGLLDSINLTYRVDREAFENLYQADDLVDDLGSLESKTRFFDNACRKDPNNPYVQQHYARMLLRAGNPQLSLQMIERAIELNADVRVLHHTKGTVLASLMLEAESNEIARRYLARAEGSFKHTVKLNRRDAYGYVGLARLYVDWARRGSGAAEGAGYIAKAEEVIQEGLGAARTRDGLWIESSRIEDLVGSETSYLSALEKAVRENPGGIMARYLLGRAYMRANREEDALQVLEPVIQNHHTEFRVFLLYAYAMLKLGKTYREAIAVLNLAVPYGYRDSRFIAALGGMYFMDGEFSEAERVFRKRLDRTFSVEELELPAFRPRDPENPKQSLMLKGKVGAVKAGFSFIQVEGYPDFFCPASKYGDVILRSGMRIVFKPAFSAKGAVALYPKSED